MAYPSEYEIDDAPRFTPAVKWLIATNVAIFFLQLVSPWGERDIQGALGFTLADLRTQPWTVATYMFVHGGLLHLAVNMYTLWLFGPRLERRWGTGAFTRFYLWCGLGGWLFHLLFDRSGLLVGASAAIFGVMLAFALRWPDEEILLFAVVPLKVKWFVLGLGVLNLVQGVSGAISAPDGSEGVAYLAHLGGLVFAWLYLHTPAAPSLDRLKQRISQVPDVGDETPRAIPRSLPRTGRDREREGRESDVDEIVAKSKAVLTQPPRQPAPVAPRRAPQGPAPTALDAVLDKISRTGMESLTRDERRILEEESRRLRQS